MTVSNTTAKVSAVGTAVAGQQIPFTFPVGATSDLTVTTRVTATGTEATLTETTDYTVALTSSGESGGTVTLVAALAATSEVFVVRSTPRTQLLDLTQGGAFNAENVEDTLDKLTRQVNDLQEQINRCLKIPVTDSTSRVTEIDNSVDRVSAYLTFDSNGDPSVTTTVSTGSTTISTYGKTLIDDANAAAARATLGAVIGTNVQAYSALLTAIAALAVTSGNLLVANGSTWTVTNQSDFFNTRVNEIVTYDDAVVMYDDNVITYV